MTRPQSLVQITALGIIALPHSQERHARQHHEPARALEKSIEPGRTHPIPPAFSPTEFLRRLRSAETLISFASHLAAKPRHRVCPNSHSARSAGKPGGRNDGCRRAPQGAQGIAQKRVRICPTGVRLVVGGLSAQKRTSDSLKPSGAHLATKARFAPIGDRTRMRRTARPSLCELRRTGREPTKHPLRAHSSLVKSVG